MEHTFSAAGRFLSVICPACLIAILLTACSEPAAPAPEETEAPVAEVVWETEAPTAPPVQASEEAFSAPFAGRWRIPEVGIDVACYDSCDQRAVDPEDSAAYYFNSGHRIIADHFYQGFLAIGDCVPGKTKAQFESGCELKSYTCVGIISGHNTEEALTDAEGIPIDDLYPGTLVNYTCDGSWQDVTIVFFQAD